MWHLKNYPTRRKLLKDVKELREENKNLKNELKKLALINPKPKKIAQTLNMH